MLVVGFELGAAGRASIDRWQANAAATQLDAPLQKILDAREATDLASADIDRLLSLHSLYPTTTLMAEVTRLMPKTPWQLKRWQQPTPDTLEVSIAAPSINPEQLVSTWESSSMLKNVTTELGSNNELVVKATLAPPVTSAASEQESQ